MNDELDTADLGMPRESEAKCLEEYASRLECEAKLLEKNGAKALAAVLRKVAQEYKQSASTARQGGIEILV